MIRSLLTALAIAVVLLSVVGAVGALTAEVVRRDCAARAKHSPQK